MVFFLPELCNCMHMMDGMYGLKAVLIFLVWAWLGLDSSSVIVTIHVSKLSRFMSVRM